MRFEGNLSIFLFKKAFILHPKWIPPVTQVLLKAFKTVCTFLISANMREKNITHYFIFLNIFFLLQTSGSALNCTYALLQQPCFSNTWGLDKTLKLLRLAGLENSVHLMVTWTQLDTKQCKMMAQMPTSISHYLASNQLICILKYNHTLISQSIPIKGKAMLPCVPNNDFN